MKADMRNSTVITARFLQQESEPRTAEVPYKNNISALRNNILKG